jgi:hypothetical protein
MNIPDLRQSSFDAAESRLVHEAIRESGLGGLTLTLDRESARLNGEIEIRPAIFDCRRQLDTRCWVVQRLTGAHGARTCSCGALARTGAEGTYGSLPAAMAAALGEVVRLRVLAHLADPADSISAERPATPAVCHNDFITQSVHT